MISRKSTGYERRQVFDTVCIAIAYTTSTIMLKKFKRMSCPYYVSNNSQRRWVKKFQEEGQTDVHNMLWLGQLLNTGNAKVIMEVCAVVNHVP